MGSFKGKLLSSTFLGVLFGVYYAVQGGPYGASLWMKS